jgi:hypothetical protein
VAFENSGKLSTDPLIAKGMGSRTGNVGGKRARPKDIKMDSDFNNSLSSLNYPNLTGPK